MNDDHAAEPPILTRIGWFFWRNWTRVVCATRGHDRTECVCCRRCGLPPRTDVSALYQEIEDLKDELRDERADRQAFHQHYVEAEADADALRGEHRG